MNNNPVILFDGVCNLCNGTVQFIIRYDKHNQFKFASLQSTEASSILEGFSGKESGLKSIILVEDGKIYYRSTAALRITKRLSFPVSLLYVFILIPAFMRDAVYNLVARNRYSWFGKKEHCMIPTEDLKSRFLNYGV